MQAISMSQANRHECMCVDMSVCIFVCQSVVLSVSVYACAVFLCKCMREGSVLTLYAASTRQINIDHAGPAV